MELMLEGHIFFEQNIFHWYLHAVCSKLGLHSHQGSANQTRNEILSSKMVIIKLRWNEDVQKLEYSSTIAG